MTYEEMYKYFSTATENCIDRDEPLRILKNLVDRRLFKEPEDHPFNNKIMSCPMCHHPVAIKNEDNSFKKINSYCSNCGQRIDWRKYGVIYLQK